MKKLVRRARRAQDSSYRHYAVGGLGIFAGFVFGCLLTVISRGAFEFQYFIAASLVIFFLGLKDDILIISP